MHGRVAQVAVNDEHAPPLARERIGKLAHERRLALAGRSARDEQRAVRMALHGLVDAHGNDAHGLAVGAAARQLLRERCRGGAAALFDAHRRQRAEIARARDLLQVVTGHDRCPRASGQVQQHQTQQHADERAAHERLPP